MNARLTVGSLFSGIGGLDLGLERAGWEVRWQSEIDPYCSRVLVKHWPHVPNLGDVTKIEWEGVERVDLICGGYPCQPFSLAGARRGTDDARHLWPYFASAIRVLRPRFALLENVPGHLSLGFGDVLSDLAALGYDAEWTCIPASAVGAPHLRFRLFVMAHAESDLRRTSGDDRPEAPDGRSAKDSHANGGRLKERKELHGEPLEGATDRRARGRHADGLRDEMADADERGCNGWAGIFEPAGRRQLADCGEWATEPDVGRVAHGIPSRVDRLRALGNAVVPQVAEFVGSQLLASLSGGLCD